MADLALGVQQLAAGIAQTLHAAFATTPLVGFLDPFALLLPVEIKLPGLVLHCRHLSLPLT